MRIFLCALLTVFGLHVLRAAGPTLPKLEGLTADAQVYTVAVYEPRFSGLSEDEITDWQELVKTLRGKDNPASYIRGLLPKSADEVLTEDVEKGKVANPDRLPLLKKKVRLRLSNAVSIAIEGKQLYDESAFAKTELPKHVKELIARGDKRTTFETQLLNRELLSLACPKCVAPTPADFQTVRVTVKAGKPVVLVTSSYSQCRWAVTVEKGAKVVGVVQFGNFAQEVTGVDVPTVNAAGILSNGQRGLTSGFNAHSEKDMDGMNRLKAAAKEVTGRDFTSFQGKYQSEKEPFVVTPSK